ncbi:nucleoside triphosphate pyrophosphohydrolase [Peribacillus sp. FSL H8-0477]|uniref:nucleoside triphosphate pyrophosphohydrolase n=1 Tax=Peribacillus sp. FSL H8-0477 TaxID=2921388 RepID=UPI0030FAEB6B
MPIYNKLVRNRIPDIIENTDRKYSTKILNEEEYIKELKRKSFEELQEYVEAETSEDAIEELADVLVIMHSLAAYHGSSIEEVERVCVQKAKNRGGF